MKNSEERRRSEIKRGAKRWTSSMAQCRSLIGGFILAAGLLNGTLLANEVTLPVGPNSWVFDAAGNCLPSRITSPEGIKNWSDAEHRIRTYFWVGASGSLDLRLTASVASGASRIRCSLGGETKEITLTNTEPTGVALGTFKVVRPGYQVLELQGLTKSASTFAEISALALSGAAADGETHFIKDGVYFGRRGPSVHLGYRLPKEAKEICWIYTEASVPIGQDALGTYCMANGFGEGYCGMQVNSATERRILFSVWSPFHTDNPKEIPESDRVALLAKGKQVHAQAFGGEGSGGQSYLVYPWRAGTVYRFLLHGEPAGDNTTVYTAYFYPPEEGQWLLLASFKRPKTETYLTRWHSFLENFSPDAGAITREGHFANQWACDKTGHWFAVTEALFTADATARKGARMDYTGGVTVDNRFFLRNCGFFSDRLTPGTLLTRTPSERPAPVIDFAALATAVAEPTGAVTLKPVPKPIDPTQWDLIWQDEFDGERLDDTKWVLCKRGSSDWMNTVSDDPRLIKVNGGILHLRGIQNNAPAKDPAPYLTGAITSQGKFTFKYGKVQIRARFKSAQGAWPALWMLGQDKGWPANGEIDLMEHLNFDDIIYQTVHSEYTLRIDKTNTPKHGGTCRIERDDWNTYGCEWDADQLVLTVNGQPTLTYPRMPEKGEKQWPFDQPFYFILSMQIGGKWVNGSGPTNPEHYPAGMEVDWVRVYTRSLHTEREPASQ